MRVEHDERRWQGWPGAASHGYARAFGEQAPDLDLDFTRLSRPELVSRLLARCLRPTGNDWSGEEVWSWTLAQRLQGLLAIALASGVAPVTLVQCCTACAEPLEIAVEPGAFEREERVTEFEWSPAPEQRLSVRLPTGRDQLEWWQAGAVSAHAMARSLVRADADDAMRDEWVDGLAEQLTQHDPLTALDLETACPACGKGALLELDLEAELLRQLHTRQQRTLRDIHRLASAYHWSEATILTLPAWRRHYYLAQLGAGGTA